MIAKRLHRFLNTKKWQIHLFALFTLNCKWKDKEKKSIGIMYFDLINIFQKYFVTSIYREKWRNVDWMILSKTDLQFIKSFQLLPPPYVQSLFQNK